MLCGLLSQTGPQLEQELVMLQVCCCIVVLLLVMGGVIRQALGWLQLMLGYRGVCMCPEASRLHCHKLQGCQQHIYVQGRH
jgi:hypothetical protein